jgi:hypothetical protein
MAKILGSLPRDNDHPHLVFPHICPGSLGVGCIGEETNRATIERRMEKKIAITRIFLFNDSMSYAIISRYG